MRYCRFCGKKGMHEFINLGHQPPSNSFLTEEQLDEPEITYPLKLFVCDSCWLVQIPEHKKAVEIFNDDYVYYSSESPANVKHAKEFVDMIVKRFNLNRKNWVLEIGSNDGYLLQHFKSYYPNDCRIQGIDPAKGAVDIAMSKGIPTLCSFFDTSFANNHKEQYDIICGINVLAHVPSINDFVEGIKIALNRDGVAIFEFPHLMNLVDKCQFDTIYHEHFHYFSFMTVCEIFHRHGLAVFDVDEIPEHGGSLRIYAKHEPSETFSGMVKEIILTEQQQGLSTINYYQGFQYKIDQVKMGLVEYLFHLRFNDQMVVAYGAAAKANTFINFCGIGQDLVEFIVDRSPYKQGKYLPGSHIRVTDEEELQRLQPDYVFITAWNLKDEIIEQLNYIREWGGKFIIAIPELEVIE